MRFYLNLLDQLSQVWLDKYMLVLTLLVIKVYLFKSTLLDGITSCQLQAEEICEALNEASGKAESVTYGINQVTDYIIVQFVNNLQLQCRLLINLAISIAKALIGFLIELYLGTLTCLCTAFVKGSIEVLADATRTATEAIETAVNAFLREFNSALNGLSTLVNGVVTTVQSIKSIFTNTDTSDMTSAVNSVNLTASTIKDITIPTTFIDDLSSLSNKIPDYEDVLSNLTSLVTKPLDKFHRDITNITSSHFSLPSTVPGNSKNLQWGTCNETSEHFMTMKKTVNSICSWIILGSCLSIIILLTILVFLTINSYKRRVRYIEELTSENDFDQIGNMLDIHKNKVWMLFNRLNMNAHFKWLLNYTFSSTARNCLLIGLAGLIGVGLQFWLLTITSRAFQQLYSLDMKNTASRDGIDNYVLQTNVALDNSSEKLNEAIFGSLDETTSSLLDTLVDVETSVNDTINSVFGSTPFAAPLRTVVYCTLGRKLDKVEDGLLWLHENLKIEFPTLQQDESKELMSTVVEDATKNSQNLGTTLKRAGDELIDTYKKSILIELFVSLFLHVG
ncbi:hypothetical protein CJJ07_001907 [Candidozyma auris]|nr:hypothetical protein CJJ07_001907 [[Candida] auris]